MTRILREIGGLPGIAVLTATLACGGDAGPVDDPAAAAVGLHGTELVVGSTLDEIGLVVMNPAGGQASWRSLRDVGTSSWQSRVELPAFREAFPTAGGAVVLRERNGEVSRFLPATEEIEQLDRLQEENARWTSSDQGGAFVDAAGGEILTVLPDGAWRYEVGESIEWAGVVHDGIALLRPDGTLTLIPHGAAEAGAESSIEVRPPGLVTAWGRRLAFVDAGDDRSVKLLTIDPPETAGEVRLDGRITAISASPSTHQLYAGTMNPPGIAIVNRFSFSQVSLARLDRAPVEIRPSLFGDFLLAFDGERILKVDLRTGDSRSVPGDWGADLPLGLPDGVVLTRRGAETYLVDAGGEIGSEPVTAPEGAVWVPVRWTPMAPLDTEELEGRQVVVEPGRPAAVGSAGQPSATGATGDEPRIGEEGESEPAAADPGVPAGFYAIVGSARQRGGIESLAEDLGTGGFPTQIQSTTDEAGETWYRGLVGPFETRAEAEAASRQLQRERQLQSWVMGIGANG